MKNLFTVVFFALIVASCSSSDEASTDTTASPPTTLAETTTTLTETTTTLTEITTTMLPALDTVSCSSSDQNSSTNADPNLDSVSGLAVTPPHLSESLHIAWNWRHSGSHSGQIPETFEIRWKETTTPLADWMGCATVEEVAARENCPPTEVMEKALFFCYRIEDLENDTEYEIEVKALTNSGLKSDAAVVYGAVYESDAALEEFLTGSFSWGPSDDARTLQIVLDFELEEIDGWYGLDTYRAHVSKLLYSDLSIENVPEPPNVASNEGEWVAPYWDIVDCELSVFDMAPLCGVEINTPSAEAIAMLVSILGPASEDTGWNDEAGCAAIGQSWRERRVSWGEIDAVFNGLNPSVFSGWRVYRNLPPLEANWPDFPISLPNGLYLGDPLEEVAAMMGYDAEELSTHSFEEYGLPGIYRFSSPEFGYQYGQSYPRINGIIDDTLLMHIASPGLPAFVFCD